MCGLSGIISKQDGSVFGNKIEVMTNKLNHRGKDDSGYYKDDCIQLGFKRLSIIDLSQAGHQPMISTDGNYVIVFNGEIYNYIEIREQLCGLGHNFKTNSDTEVVLNAFLEYGPKSLSLFIGMWALAIYNKASRTVFLARDRYGIKPLYFYSDASMYCFASEIPPILDIIDKKPTPNDSCIYNFLSFNRSDYSESTFFREISSIPKGGAIEIDLREDRIKHTKWYDLKSEVENSSGFANSEEYYEALRLSNKLHLRSDTPVGVTFSGGLDSSSILSLALMEKSERIKTFSAVYGKGVWGDESEFIDLYEKQHITLNKVTPTSEDYFKDYEDLILTHAEPFASSSIYAQYKVMELASKQVKVVLDGQGADECLGGYEYFFAFYWKELFNKSKYSRLIDEIVKNVLFYHSLRNLKYLGPTFIGVEKLFNYSLRRSDYITSGFSQKNAESREVFQLFSGGTLQQSLINHVNYKLEHLLKWQDRNSMRFSVEARVPFLNYGLVERTLATTSDILMRNGRTKSMLSEAMSKIVPDKIRNRKLKIGFATPQALWIKEPKWAMQFRSIFDSKAFNERGIFEKDKVSKLLVDHLSGIRDNSKQLWKIYCLEMWYRKFID